MIGDIEAAMAGFRAAAEELMVDTCRITGEGTTGTDPVTGARTNVDGPLIYAGVCKQQEGTTEPRDADVNDSTVTTIRPEIHIPAGSPRIPPGSVVEIITSPNRPDAIGRRLRVLASHLKTWQTAQRIPVEETL